VTDNNEVSIIIDKLNKRNFDNLTLNTITGNMTILRFL
jgi:hypothetical protein